jgi:hypothetical protein
MTSCASPATPPRAWSSTTLRQPNQRGERGRPFSSSRRTPAELKLENRIGKHWKAGEAQSEKPNDFMALSTGVEPVFSTPSICFPLLWRKSGTNRFKRLCGQWETGPKGQTQRQHCCDAPVNNPVASRVLRRDVGPKSNLPAQTSSLQRAMRANQRRIDPAGLSSWWRQTKGWLTYGLGVEPPRETT